MIKLIGSEDYYPTPEKLLNEITAGLEWNKIESVLEPSAGKGNIAEFVFQEKKITVKPRYTNIYQPFSLDCIEIEPELQAILREKNFRVVHNDFLTFHTYKHYDLIIMNPPFSAGAKHLLKAIEIQQTSGGAIICILNAETIRNPYTNERKDLVQKLEDYNAGIEYYENAFANSERPSDIEVAVVKFIVPEPKRETFIFENLREKEYKEYEGRPPSELAESDFIKAIVALYNREIEYGLRLYHEYLDYEAYTLDNKSLISFEVKDLETLKSDTFTINRYVREVRQKYWYKLFKSPQFIGRLTSDLQHQYLSRINELVGYDFSYWNIKTLQAEIAKHIVSGVEEAIIKLFDELSHKHYWDADGVSGNIHYYNGWKTNSAYKINKKVIIPLRVFRRWNAKYDWGYYPMHDGYGVLSDIERVLNYLDNGETPNVDLENTLFAVQSTGQSQYIECKYFIVTFYKKGTCHLTFTNERLLKKLNIFGSQKKGWLPKGYARKRYEEMTHEEQDVIESFEGQQSYNESLMDAQYYLFDVNASLPMLG